MTRIESRVACALAAVLVALLAGHADTPIAQSATSRWVLADEYPLTSLAGRGAGAFPQTVRGRRA